MTATDDILAHLKAAYYEVQLAESAIERLMLEFLVQCRRERRAFRVALRQQERHAKVLEKAKVSNLVLSGKLKGGNLRLQWAWVWRPKGGGRKGIKGIKCAKGKTNPAAIRAKAKIPEEVTLLLRHEMMARDIRALWTDHVHTKRTVRAAVQRLTPSSETQAAA